METSKVSYKDVNTNGAWTKYFEQNMDNQYLIHHWAWGFGNSDDAILELRHSMHYCANTSVLLHSWAARRLWENKHKEVHFQQP